MIINIEKTNNRIPAKGDIIVIDFDPQMGVEMKKRRPALVVSETFFQEKTGLVWVLPITSSKKDGFPLHVNIAGGETHGDIICEQIKSFDYNARNWRRVGQLSAEQFEDVRDKIFAILG